MKVKGTRALVMGAGISGEAAAELLVRFGGSVMLIDQRPETEVSDVSARLRALGVAVRFGPWSTLPEGSFDFAVVSPAFEMEHPWVEDCRGRNIPLLSELELGSRFWKKKILAVTGSKGKTSLVKLCADTLEAAGQTSSPGGNYGIPLCSLCLQHPELDWAVVEVSSFQMEHTETFSPDIAILLNLQADHLNRHHSMAEYKALKLKMFSAMRQGTLALMPVGLEADDAVPEGVEIQHFGVGEASSESGKVGVWCYHPGNVTFSPAVLGVPQTEPSMDVSLEGSWFDNSILGAAASAAVAALTRAGLTPKQIRAGFLAFRSLPHRMQRLGKSASGVIFVDDSKATSLSALSAALTMVKKQVRLIAGGILKETDVDCVKELLTTTTKKVYLMGRCAQQLADAWSGTVPCEVCGTVERAVERAVAEAVDGDTVLLSPGTASFDQFSGYRERGERFTAQVRKVAGL